MNIRAKLEVRSVTPPDHPHGSEKVELSCVCGNSGFGPNGESEDNSFARWTPSGGMRLEIINPNIIGKFKPGQKFYADLTPAE